MPNPSTDELSILMHGRDMMGRILARAEAIALVDWNPRTPPSEFRNNIRAEAIRQMKFLVSDMQNQMPPMIEIQAVTGVLSSKPPAKVTSHNRPPSPSAAPVGGDDGRS